jgi:hypothetical protein
MCTRLHAIGFPCEIDRQTAMFIAGAAASAKRRVVSPRGEYRIWRSPTGAEIWLHYAELARPKPAGGGSPEAGGEAKPFDAIADLSGMSIVHGGTSNVRMRLVRSIATSSKNPLEGLGIGSLGSIRPNERPIVFTFELLGFALERVGRPMDVRVQLTALAQRVWAYPSEAAYLSGTPSRRLIARGAIADVTPTDLADLQLIYEPKPGSLWLITGDVIRSMRLINPVTSAPYYWISLATDRGNFDVIANPSIIQGEISDGPVVQAVVSVTGRILERHG